MRHLFFKLLLCVIWVNSIAAPRVIFKLKSQAFHYEGRIPNQYAKSGKNISPPLAWAGAPRGTKSYALVMFDYDAERERVCLYNCLYDTRNNPKCPIVHWVLYNIPANVHYLKAGETAFTKGLNSYHQKGYIGMNPPRGKKHHYYFNLYALNIPRVYIPKTSNGHDLLYAARQHIIGEAELVGTYQKPTVIRKEKGLAHFSIFNTGYLFSKSTHIHSPLRP